MKKNAELFSWNHSQQNSSDGNRTKCHSIGSLETLGGIGTSHPFYSLVSGHNSSEKNQSSPLN